MCDAGVDENNTWNATTKEEINRWNKIWFQFRQSTNDTDELKKRAVEMRRKRDPNVSTSGAHYKPVEGNFTSYPRSWMPDSVMRVFHPTSITNTFITNLIIDMVVVKQVNQQKIDVSLQETS
jgi:hypothetical protein